MDNMLLLGKGIYFDFSKSLLVPGDLDVYQALIDKAFKDMADLESGEMANPDEERMVGHYWLRDPEMAPDGQTEREIQDAHRAVRKFAEEVREGKIVSDGGETFLGVLYLGIGGSALGPQLLRSALGGTEGMEIHFLDNTDPDTFYELADRLGDSLRRYLVVVVSKSGGTRETANMAEEVRMLFRRKGWQLAKNAVAITVTGSKLHQMAQEESWLATFPLWDWVGGRTSVASAVGLLPLYLLGKDGKSYIEGMVYADKSGRRQAKNNPALLMALELLRHSKEQQRRQLVVLPYKDKLELFSKYLQQLVMESLGKELNLAGEVVHEGVAVYGNKGSTDQHSYLQQLFDGPNNFSTHFITVRESRQDQGFLPNGNLTGDYLHAFYAGTASALRAKGRYSLTISLPRVDAFYLGFLIALYERMVGFYASMAGINAYHQPAVESGKKAAEKIVLYKIKIVEMLREEPEKAFTVKEIADIYKMDQEEIFLLMEYLADTAIYGIAREGESDDCTMADYRYRIRP